ncbi:protein-glutamate methylesterase/protein-glutamine glutaminase [Oryzibacter oryziterrae]|uniref:protein-glutamate methylesterase/protein-glutamine glutaminase n=1 Tax=Oryzibacter oryziterrae TaxID=2766474 RepID=UPI001F4519E3|nr:chemotaxis response regulator protein-glutamate methylesterase [Oryzibacter oryziterrae]
MTAARLRVLIVDDSALMRELLSRLLGSDPEIEVIGAAADPYAAREMIKRLTPDVITLDVEMPGMNGIAFLEKIMTLRPMPVVMISTLTQSGARATLTALQLGAVDCVAKPSGSGRDIERQREEIITKVKAAAVANVHRLTRQHQVSTRMTPSGPDRPVTLIAIGASTGGVEAVSHIIAPLPAEMPPIVIVQHMPPHFTRHFAERLDEQCALKVKEAEDGEPLRPGTVYIAPGGRQFEVGRSGPRRVCVLGGEERVSGHCPSVDVLFRSVSRLAPADALGILLTGMGRDGAAGLLEMRLAGALCIGQDEASSVVYGMPKAAFENGAASMQMSLETIPDYLTAHFSHSKKQQDSNILLQADCDKMMVAPQH